MNQPFNTTTPLPPMGLDAIRREGTLPPKLQELFNQCNTCFGATFYYKVNCNGSKEKVLCPKCHRNVKD